MKNIIILIVSILFTALLYGQNQEVDKRNGFKDIKLGSHYSSFKGIRNTKSNDPNNIKGLWSTSDKNLGYFFNNEIDFFELTFDKGTKELIAMQIVLLIKKPYSDPSVYGKYFSLADKLTMFLGKASKVKQKEMSILWYGAKVGMGFKLESESLDYDDDNNLRGITSLRFSVVSFEVIEKQMKKGF